MNLLGQRIRILRKQKGLTQEELVAGKITRNQLSMIEKGTANPSMDTLKYIALRLDTTVSKLMNEEVYTVEECNQVIDQCTKWVESGEFRTVIKHIERFLREIPDGRNFAYKDLLGRLYSILGNAYFKVKDARAEHFLLESLKYLDKEVSYAYLCKSLNFLGIIYYENKDYISARQFLKEADLILKDLPASNVLLRLHILYNLVLSYVVPKEYDEAIPYINELLKYAKEHEIYRYYGDLNMLLAISYRNSKNYTEAYKCNMKAVNYYRLKEDAYAEHRCYINLAIVYRHQKEYPNSLRQIRHAIRYFEQIGDIKKLTDAKAERIKTLFYVLKDKTRLIEAINSILHAQAIDGKDKAELSAILRLIHLSDESDESGDTAVKQLRQAEKELEAFDDSEFLPHICMALSKLYKKQENMGMAYHYLSKANEVAEGPWVKEM